LLNAIVNSITGADASVAGKYSGLNSMNFNAIDIESFNFSSDGQGLATLNGRNLYNAVYAQCRNAVIGDCNDAALQRAVVAYNMQIEQDCNTLEKSLDENEKKLAAEVRNSDAMLDLARIENRQKLNSSDAATCLAEVERAITADGVCGEGYRKCLDNGRFIDVTTGKPIQGVVDFYKLDTLLAFSPSAPIDQQKLSQNPNNTEFMKTFEKKVRPFAEEALGKCVEIAGEVWADYLDKALLEIHYAQVAKVNEMRTGCMDFVSACYGNASKSLTNPMLGLINDAALLQPDYVATTAAMCTEYVAACDNMFGGESAGGIIAQYVEMKKDQDLESACGAIAQRCFDNFGGDNYVNFYRPGLGYITSGNAMEWFVFQNINGDIVSECARQMVDIAACSDRDMARRVFGGFFPPSDTSVGNDYTDEKWVENLASSGIASRVYLRTVQSLAAECETMDGRFVELPGLTPNTYNRENTCISEFRGGVYDDYVDKYNIGISNNDNKYDGIENMCPYNYEVTHDVKSWGACLCWENGGRRSENGRSQICVPGKGSDNKDRYIRPDGEPDAGKVCPGSADTSCDGVDLVNIPSPLRR
jgi:hypothetical protein